MGDFNEGKDAGGSLGVDRRNWCFVHNIHAGKMATYIQLGWDFST